MATTITSSQSWLTLKQFYIESGGTGYISSSDVEKVMKNADANRDGVITSDEFVNSCEEEFSDKNSDLMMKIGELTDEELDKLVNDVVNGTASDEVEETATDVEDVETADVEAGKGAGGGAGAVGGAGGSGASGGRSSLVAPSLISGWISDFANTPQRAAIV